MNLEDLQFIAEDDHKRSQTIYSFLMSPEKYSSTDESSIPKVIVQYWHSLNELPQDVQDCIKSWRILKEKGFEFKFFDDQQARNFIEEHFEKEYVESYAKCHHPAMRCDYFRLCYLYIHGGLYVDCDEFYLNSSIEDLYSNNNLKIQPLCFSLSSNSMIKDNCFLNDKYHSDYIYYFNNNPIISPPKHELIQLSLKRATSKLVEGININDIQSTTGPGNISASFAYYLLKNQFFESKTLVSLIKNWEKISLSPWPLSYRNDNRNWRLYDSDQKYFT